MKKFFFAADQAPAPLKTGIIGLDTSHAISFTKILNDPEATEDVASCRVVAVYPKGSRDIKSSVSRVPEYTQEIQKLGVEIVDTIEELVKRVDVVLLESNDGRPHLEQARLVFQAGKSLFVDKPFAGSLADAVAIFEAARKHGVPVFSSSSLRYGAGTKAAHAGELGEIIACDTYSPAPLHPTHPDFFWYGIHGVESLFTVMGRGCESVTRVSAPDMDMAVGKWKNGRIGSFRGMRTNEHSYGGIAFGTKKTAPVGTYDGDRPLMVEIVRFFKTGVPPVTEDETLEIYAFMEAADESKRRGGVPVTVASVLSKAREAASKR